MKLTSLALGLAALLLAACGTKPYTPMEYTLRDGLIPAMTVTGDASVKNVQPSEAEAIVYSYGGTALASSLKAITQLMVDQTTKEIAKNTKIKAAGGAKTIELKVDAMQSHYVAFSWKSELRYTAVLGGTITVQKTVHHASGVLLQDLNGVIAESVLDLLKDPQVVAYLAQ